MTSTLDGVKLIKPAVANAEFKALKQVFPKRHFKRLQKEGFPFYRTTFWYPLNRSPENIFESIACGLRAAANPCDNVIGVEWWFSVLLTNATPQWLLPCHFDRNDLAEKDFKKIRHPNIASVLFLNSVPYGDLVVTDQTLTERGKRPRQPSDMRFIRPSRNQYAVFPGNLYHGVIGRMQNPVKDTKLRVAMALNWWTEKPVAPYLRDSRECLAAFQLKA